MEEDRRMKKFVIDIIVNVNWYILMEQSRKSHAIELILIIGRNSQGERLLSVSAFL